MQISPLRSKPLIEGHNTIIAGSGFKRFAQILVGLISIGFIIHHFLNNQEELSALTKITFGKSFQITFILLIVAFFQSQKTLLPLKDLGATNLTAWHWFQICSISGFINFHIVQGSNVYRILKLKKSYNISYTDSLSATIYLSWIDFIIYLILASVTAHFLPTAQSRIQIGLLLLLVFTILIPIGAKWGTRAIPDNLPSPWKYGKNKLKDLTTNLTHQTHNIRLIMSYSLWTFFIFVLYSLAVRICFYSIGVEAGWTGIILFTLTMIISRNFNVTPGNLGISELICGFTANYMGGSLTSGILVSIIIRILNYGLLGLLSLIFYKSWALNPAPKNKDNLAHGST